MVPRFAHNPTVHYVSGIGTTAYLYHIGCGHNSTVPNVACANGTTPAAQTSPDGHLDRLATDCDGPHYMMGRSAPSLDGPWTPLAAEITLSVDDGKGCYFLVFVPTIRETRDFYREM
eukprot:SAG31_NODE_1690_length_7524_cov_2.991919_2_plen_117_part_00